MAGNLKAQAGYETGCRQAREGVGDTALAFAFARSFRHAGWRKTHVTLAGGVSGK
jgi:hypothetical protein